MRATPHKRGFALVSVVVGVAILMLIAGIMLSSVLLSRRAARAGTEALQAKALHEAAVAQTVLALGDKRLDHRPRVDGVPQVITVLGTPIEVTVQDEYGRFDLNVVDGSVITRLLERAGLDGQSAAALSDKIQDWREAGPGKRLNGATADDYKAAGFSYAPRRGPFRSLDELKLVMGMTPDLFERLRPALTIYTGRPGLDPASAPLQALEVLPGYDPDRAQAMIAARAGGTQAPIGPVTQGRIDPTIPIAGWPFAIQTRINLGQHTVERDTVIRVTGDPKRPFWVLDER